MTNSIEELLRIARAQQLQQIDVARRASNTIDAAWTAFGGITDQAMADFVGAALPIMSTSIDASIKLSDAHLAQYLGAATGDSFDTTGIGIDDVVYRGGTDIAKVYERPTRAARQAIAQGKSYAQAMQVGRSRAMQTADTDVMQAARNSAIQIMKTVPRIQGYRRIPDGNACEYCQIAATQRYRVGELMPVHSHCHCSTVPIIGTKDPGRIIDREAHQKLKDSGAIDQKNYERKIRETPELVDKYRATAQHWRDEARTTPSQQAETRYAKRADHWEALAKAKEDELAKDRRILAEIKAKRAGDTSAIKVHDHGELGPVLAPANHGFGEDLTPTPPTPPVRRTKSTVLDKDVLAEASRKNISPERVIEQREEKAERRYLEQRARREAEKAISVDHPDVIAAAKKHGVSPDEVIAARRRVGDVRAAAREEAAQVSADSFHTLDSITQGSPKLKPPPLKSARTEFGARARGGEYDFLEQTSARERARLSRVWYGGNTGPDQMAELMSTAIGKDLSSDEAMKLWLHHNRISESAGALRRGKLPSLDAYSGQIDPDELLPLLRAQGFKATEIFGDDLNAAAHIASMDRHLGREDAVGYLGDAFDAKHGPKPYHMSYDSWETEVREIEERLADGTATALDFARHREIVPQYLDEPGTSFEELHARIVDTARTAGEDVSTGIEWIDDYAGLDRQLFKVEERILPKPAAPATPAKIRPPPNAPKPADSISFDSEKAQQKFGPTIDRLGELMSGPVDDLEPTRLVFGKKTNNRGGVFAVKSPPKPRRPSNPTPEQKIDYEQKMHAWRAKGATTEIRINQWDFEGTMPGDPMSPGAGNTDLFTFLHEFGHRIDFVPEFKTNQKGDKLISGGEFLSERGKSPAMKAFFDAARATPSLANTPTVYGGKFASYLQDPTEVWARAFSQWAARELGGPEHEAFKILQRNVQWQWTDEEFDVLHPLVEGILRDRGFLA